MRQGVDGFFFRDYSSVSTEAMVLISGRIFLDMEEIARLAVYCF